MTNAVQQDNAGSATFLAQVVDELQHATDADARQAALESLATTSGALMFPCIVFKQGGRLNIATAFPLSFVAQHIKPEPARKGGDPRGATNRPLMPDHVRSIYNYLKENRSRYILPPVTLNVRQIPQVHVTRTNAAVRSGYLIVPHETVFYVTDGMHRVAAIAGHDAGKNRTPGILEGYEDDLQGDGLAVVIVVEESMPQIHQDFADAAHSKPIPASLLAAYNMREPVNQVLHQVVEQSIFQGRVDETSKTLSKLSPHMFLLNQVRSLIKALLVGDYAVADTALERQALLRFQKAPEAQAEFTKRTLELLDVLSKNMDPWDKIAQTKPNTGAAERILDLRPKYLNLTASGLGIIGQVAFEINKRDEGERIRLYEALAKLDWKRNAQMWQGTVVQGGDKLATNRFAVDGATKAVKDALGLAD
ncbi:MAG: DNA sulfur modification protein DndB [Chthoniobacterales bacterium]